MEPEPPAPAPPPPARGRIMNSDGTVNIERLGMRTSWWRDFYHFVINADWPQVLLLLVVAYLALNLFFAILFWLPGNAINTPRPPTFLDAFFFSVQTFSTIGYGGMAPVGLLANLLVIAEVIVSLLFTAMATGLTFAKFATPTSRVRFSRTAILGTHDGAPAFFFRMANERTSQIVEATMTVSLIRNERTQEGERLRRFYDMKLRRAGTPVFSLGWTAYHMIDEDSPLHGATRASLVADEAVILVSFMGTDSALGQTVHARYAYAYMDLEFDRRFVDLLRERPDGTRVIDYRRFHDTEPCAQDDPHMASMVG